jgi:site-specific DNA-methyltransferase (adenine-specific)
MDKATQATMFSSKSNEWETGDLFFNSLNDRFQFTLDAAATKDNAKCDNFFSIEDDALNKDWSNNIVFLNPPYGRKIGKWVEKAFDEGCKENTIVVVLIPSRTDTQFFHKFCMRAKEVHFVKGRLKFKNKMIEGEAPAPFPSMVVVFDGAHSKPEFFTMGRDNDH